LKEFPMTKIETPVRIVGGGAAVLVRPDRFVAWRSIDAAEDPAVELAAALSQILGRTIAPVRA
jgi:hypothetical protein